ETETAITRVLDILKDIQINGLPEKEPALILEREKTSRSVTTLSQPAIIEIAGYREYFRSDMIGISATIPDAMAKVSQDDLRRLAGTFLNGLRVSVAGPKGCVLPALDE